MKSLTSPIYFLFFALLLSSCGHDFFIPEQANLLILEEKKDLKTSISYNHLQAAYSPLNHLGLKVSGTFNSVRPSTENHFRKLYMGGIGFGTYTSKVIKPLNKRKRKIPDHPQLCFIGAEIYANASLGVIRTLGSSNNVDFFVPGSRSTRSFESNLFNPHLSTQLYWQSRTFTLNLGFRLGALYYYNALGFGSYSESDLKFADNLVKNTPFLLTEYDLQIAKGNNRLQTFLQVSWNDSFSEFFNPYASVSFGLKINVPNLIKSMKRIEH